MLFLSTHIYIQCPVDLVPIWFDYRIGLPCTGAADNEMWGTENLTRNGDLKFCIKMVDEKLWY